MIHIEGIHQLGYKNQALFERHAVGGEYGVGWNEVEEGTLLKTYIPKDGGAPFVILDKQLAQADPLPVVLQAMPGTSGYAIHCHQEDRVQVTGGVLGHHEAGLRQEYKGEFINAGLLDRSGGELQHLISNAATMKLIRWMGGEFGMA
ncbi:hypothetical protein ACHAWF_003468, partial [Thalassiosira exigua]